MPHQIRITGIRCERLQDISDEDCMKEGVVDVTYFKRKSPHSASNNITVYEAMAADAVSYADALLEELEKKK